MTLYTQTPEPDVDPLYTRHKATGEVLRWALDSAPGDSPRVYRAPNGLRRTWHALLGLPGVEVHDQHPDLPEGAPTPWTVDGQRVQDADGCAVAWISGERTSPVQDEQHAALIVRAVNAHVERLRNPQPTAEPEPEADRFEEALARKGLDTAVNELVRLWSDATVSVMRAVANECDGLAPALTRLVVAHRAVQQATGGQR